MELNPKRKVLIVLAGLGVVALMADRMFLGGGGGPVEAAASSGATGRSGSKDARDRREEAPAVQTADRGSGGDGKPLLHRMKALPEARDYERVAGLDAFKPPSSWLPEPVVIEDDFVEIEPDRRGELFAQQRLTAILSGPLGDYAVIGGRTFQIGQELDGFTLIAIHERSATFRAPPVEGGEAVEVTLTLPDPSSRRPSRK